MKTLGFALMTVLFASASVAQTPRPPQPPAQKPDQDTTIRVNATLVNTTFTTVDKKGKFVTNLKQDDFKVYEDDKLQSISNFSTETNLPLSISLLVDTSGSIRDKLSFEQEAAIDFFYNTIKKGKDRGMVISFDSAVSIEQEFSDDPEVLSKAIRKIKAGGGTSLYDAVFLAINERLAKESDDRRRVMILISDGDDNSSRVSLTETLEVAQRNNITVYCISTNQTAYFGSKDQDRGDKTLKKFSEETGGKASFPLKISDIGNDFRDIGDELRSQYTIGYRPTKLEDGTFRKIRIEVASNKNYKARHRTGYYAPKPVSKN